MPDLNPNNLFGYLIQDLARLLSRSFEQQAGALKVTRSQARVLAYVALNEGSRQSEIATLMDVQKIALSKMVDALEQQSLVQRRLDKTDKRVRRLYLVDGARPVLNQIWQTLDQVSNIALATLPDSRRRSLIKSLGEVREHLLTALAVNSDQQPKAGKA